MVIKVTKADFLLVRDLAIFVSAICAGVLSFTGNLIESTYCLASIPAFWCLVDVIVAGLYP